MYNTYGQSINVDRINNQIQELERLKSQIQQPAPITQNFQIAPSNNTLKYVNSISDVERECYYAKTVREFAREHPYGKYAVTMPSHITAVVNGIIVDTFDPSDYVMRCAWKIDK